jgi:hypothetical protein
MIGNERVTCITCKFCDVQNSKEGICRREPPTVALVMSPQGPNAMAIRTVIQLAADWCSHYEQQLVKPASGNVLSLDRGK